MDHNTEPTLALEHLVNLVQPTHVAAAAETIPAIPLPEKTRGHQRVEVEELGNKELAHGAHFVKLYPGRASNAIGPQTRTRHRSIRVAQAERWESVYVPFPSKAEWEVARWAEKNVGHKQMDSLLSLNAVSPSTMTVASCR
jgi:hypothetical protein